jgi:hypothetical protein
MSDTLTPPQVPPSTNGPAIADKPLRAVNGFVMLFFGLGLLGYFIWLAAVLLAEAGTSHFASINFGLNILAIVTSFIVLNGLVVLQPN